MSHVRFWNVRSNNGKEFVMKAIVLRERGGPEQLKLADVPTRKPGPGEALVQVAAAGVNFMDVGVRNGKLWTDRPLPLVPGVDGAGHVVEVGNGVDAVRVGDRVAWVFAAGSYAESLTVPAAALVPVPDGIDDQTAASIMLQGITASHFATEFYAVQPGDVALVHAAAGGVGRLLTSIIKARGGRVIARVSSDNKVEAARAAGAEHVIVESGGTFAEEVKALTSGQGVKVVYDGSGAATFDDSLASLSRNGVLAYYGPVLGAPKPINIATLPRSIKVGFPTFADHISDRRALLARTRQLFDWIATGELKSVYTTYPLAQAAQAHTDLEARRTVGKLLLIPG
jgi:NADPH2:quinone reductase